MHRHYRTQGGSERQRERERERERGDIDGSERKGDAQSFCSEHSSDAARLIEEAA